MNVGTLGLAVLFRGKGVGSYAHTCARDLLGIRDSYRNRKLGTRELVYIGRHGRLST